MKLGSNNKTSISKTRVARTRVAKTLVAFLSLGSVLGLNSTAFAEEASWTVEVQVTDTSCVSVINPASWQPETTVSYPVGNTVDLIYAPVSVEFYVWLDFQAGSDSCDPGVFILPYGDVEASFLELAPELDVSALACESPFPCDASDLYLATSEITGTLDVLGAAVGGNTYSGNLKVVWVPEDAPVE
jgi:hypothetical protein